MKSESMRLFLAGILSIIVIFGYNAIFTPDKTKQKDNKQATSKTEYINADSTSQALHEQDTGIEQSSNQEKIGSIDNLDTSTQLETIIDRAQLIATEYERGQRANFSNNEISGSINLKGAVFDDIILLKHTEELKSKKDSTTHSDYVNLLSPTQTEQVFYTKTGLLPTDKSIIVPDNNSIWTLETNAKLSPNKPIVLSYTSEQNIIFYKEISIDEKFMITEANRIVNNSTMDITLVPFALINRVEPSGKKNYISHEGGIAVADNKLYEKTYSDLQDNNFLLKDISGWLGITDKYWMVSIFPQGFNEDKFNLSMRSYDKASRKRYQVDVSAQPILVKSGDAQSYSFKIYAGAKQLSTLDAYEKQYNIPLFDRAIDFGILYFLTRPIFMALHYFNSIIGNFGVAILLLTVCIRLILFPLANKSYKSMARMRKHMPEINAMRERYKNDRAALGQEMMKYYREHKINPVSGCFPMLVQIPVFFSLYKVLYVTIEMRHQPFILWIQDLSISDPTNLFNLFGLLPFTPPAFLPVIGVLPLLFSFTMFLQQKLNPPPTDETQKIVFSLLPWAFLLLFASFPAGLVLYWVWNNILSILQQYIITRKIEQDKDE